MLGIINKKYLFCFQILASYCLYFIILHDTIYVFIVSKQIKQILETFHRSNLLLALSHRKRKIYLSPVQMGHTFHCIFNEIAL